MKDVYLVWHVHPLESGDDEKLVGVYASEEDARAAIQRLRTKPGFVSFPEGFMVEAYELGKDHWTEGYVTV